MRPSDTEIYRTAFWIGLTVTAFLFFPASWVVVYSLLYANLIQLHLLEASPRITLGERIAEYSIIPLSLLIAGSFGMLAFRWVVRFGKTRK